MSADAPLPFPSTLTETQKSALERFSALFSELSADNVRARASETYAPEAWFYDTLKEVRGAEAIEAYLVESASMCQWCRATIEDVAVSGEELYVRWTMEMELKRYAKGRVLRSRGISRLRADAEGRVARHEDFWDAAAGLFEHLPVVGALIRFIKSRV